MKTLQEELKKAAPDKIIIYIAKEAESESGVMGLNGKPIEIDTSYDPHAYKPNHGLVLHVPDYYTPDTPVFQEGRNGRLIRQKELPKEVWVGDTVYFNWNSIGDGNRLAPGIYFLTYKEIIGKEYNTGMPDYPSKAFFPIACHVLLKPIFKSTVTEVDPVNQPGVMGEVTASGIISTTDQHLRGNGDIGAFKLAHEERLEWLPEEEAILPEKLITNDLYIRNLAKVAYIGSNILHRAPVAKVGDKVVINLIDRGGMPNVPTIKIFGEEYFVVKQHEIEGVLTN